MLHGPALVLQFESRPTGLLRQEFPHLAKNLSLPVDEAGVTGIREHHDPGIRKLSSEMFDFLLVVLPLCLEKLPGAFSLRLGQCFGPVHGLVVTDDEKRKSRRLDFAVLGRG
jgi:hypothetical protein